MRALTWRSSSAAAAAALKSRRRAFSYSPLSSCATAPISFDKFASLHALSAAYRGANADSRLCVADALSGRFASLLWTDKIAGASSARASREYRRIVYYLARESLDLEKCIHAHSLVHLFVHAASGIRAGDVRLYDAYAQRLNTLPETQVDGPLALHWKLLLDSADRVSTECGYSGAAASAALLSTDEKGIHFAAQHLPSFYAGGSPSMSVARVAARGQHTTFDRGVHRPLETPLDSLLPPSSLWCASPALRSMYARLLSHALQSLSGTSSSGDSESMGSSLAGVGDVIRRITTLSRSLSSTAAHETATSLDSSDADQSKLYQSVLAVGDDAAGESYGSLSALSFGASSAASTGTDDLSSVSSGARYQHQPGANSLLLQSSIAASCGVADACIRLLHSGTVPAYYRSSSERCFDNRGVSTDDQLQLGAVAVPSASPEQELPLPLPPVWSWLPITMRTVVLALQHSGSAVASVDDAALDSRRSLFDATEAKLLDSLLRLNGLLRDALSPWKNVSSMRLRTLIEQLPSSYAAAAAADAAADETADIAAATISLDAASATTARSGIELARLISSSSALLSVLTDTIQLLRGPRFLHHRDGSHTSPEPGSQTSREPADAVLRHSVTSLSDVLHLISAVSQSSSGPDVSRKSSTLFAPRSNPSVDATAGDCSRRGSNSTSTSDGSAVHSDGQQRTGSDTCWLPPHFDRRQLSALALSVWRAHSKLLRVNMGAQNTDAQSTGAIARGDSGYSITAYSTSDAAAAVGDDTTSSAASAAVASSASGDSSAAPSGQLGTVSASSSPLFSEFLRLSRIRRIVLDIAGCMTLPQPTPVSLSRLNDIKRLSRSPLDCIDGGFSIHGGPSPRPQHVDIDGDRASLSRVVSEGVTFDDLLCWTQLARVCAVAGMQPESLIMIPRHVSAKKMQSHDYCSAAAYDVMIRPKAQRLSPTPPQSLTSTAQSLTSQSSTSTLLSAQGERLDSSRVDSGDMNSIIVTETTKAAADVPSSPHRDSHQHQLGAVSSQLTFLDFLLRLNLVPLLGTAALSASVSYPVVPVSSPGAALESAQLNAADASDASGATQHSSNRAAPSPGALSLASRMVAAAAAGRRRRFQLFRLHRAGAPIRSEQQQQQQRVSSNESIEQQHPQQHLLQEQHVQQQSELSRAADASKSAAHSVERDVVTTRGYESHMSHDIAAATPTAAAVTGSARHASATVLARDRTDSRRSPAGEGNEYLPTAPTASPAAEVNENAPTAIATSLIGRASAPSAATLDSSAHSAHPSLTLLPRLFSPPTPSSSSSSVRVDTGVRESRSSRTSTLELRAEGQLLLRQVELDLAVNGRLFPRSRAAVARFLTGGGVDAASTDASSTTSTSVGDAPRLPHTASSASTVPRTDPPPPISYPNPHTRILEKSQQSRLSILLELLTDTHAVLDRNTVVAADVPVRLRTGERAYTLGAMLREGGATYQSDAPRSVSATATGASNYNNSKGDVYSTSRASDYYSGRSNSSRVDVYSSSNAPTIQTSTAAAPAEEQQCSAAAASQRQPQRPAFSSSSSFSTSASMVSPGSVKGGTAHAHTNNNSAVSSSNSTTRSVRGGPVHRATKLSALIKHHSGSSSSGGGGSVHSSVGTSSSTVLSIDRSEQQGGPLPPQLQLAMDASPRVRVSVRPLKRNFSSSTSDGASTPQLQVVEVPSSSSSEGAPTSSSSSSKSEGEDEPSQYIDVEVEVDALLGVAMGRGGASSSPSASSDAKRQTKKKLQSSSDPSPADSDTTSTRPLPVSVRNGSGTLPDDEGASSSGGDSDPLSGGSGDESSRGGRDMAALSGGSSEDSSSGSEPDEAGGDAQQQQQQFSSSALGDAAPSTLHSSRDDYPIAGVAAAAHYSRARQVGGGEFADFTVVAATAGAVTSDAPGAIHLASAPHLPLTPSHAASIADFMLFLTEVQPVSGGRTTTASVEVVPPSPYKRALISIVRALRDACAAQHVQVDARALRTAQQVQLGAGQSPPAREEELQLEAVLAAAFAPHDAALLLRELQRSQVA